MKTLLEKEGIKLLSEKRNSEIIYYLTYPSGEGTSIKEKCYKTWNVPLQVFPSGDKRPVRNANLAALAEATALHEWCVQYLPRAMNKAARILGVKSGITPIKSEAELWEDWRS